MPFSVLLVIPLGIVGAVIAATLRDLQNDVYFRVALVTTMGLSSKNAILIVEFAEAAYHRGASAVDAAITGARLRLRPIVMTSLAFVAGVMPLAISTGAGANARVSIGSGIVGHLGVEPLPDWWTRVPLVRSVTGGSFHARHHQDVTCNYGFYTLIWDRLFGSLRSDYWTSFGKVPAWVERKEPEAPTT